MKQLGRCRGCGLGQIALLCQNNRKTTTHRISRDATSIDAAADYEQVGRVGPAYHWHANLPQMPRYKSKERPESISDFRFCAIPPKANIERAYMRMFLSYPCLKFRHSSAIAQFRAASRHGLEAIAPPVFPSCATKELERKSTISFANQGIRRGAQLSSKRDPRHSPP